MGHNRNLAAALGKWSARHRIAAVTGWLLVVVATMAVGAAVGQRTMTDAEYGTGESGQALRLLADGGVTQPAQELVLVHSATGAASELQGAVQAVVSAVQGTGVATDVREPTVSADGRDVLVQFAMVGTADQQVQQVLDAVAEVRATQPNVRIEQFGDATANKWFNDTIMEDFRRAEWTAVPLALGILLVVFGALVAAILPVALALTAFLAANGLLALISHAMHVDPSASSVMLLMGLAVGVDYCLFYLRREREERAAGRDRRDALEVAAATSGRSVLISGLTVIVAMAGMFLSGMQLFAGFAVATISVVLVAVVGSVTVLPALLSMLGDRVDLGRIPLLGRRRRHAEGSGTRTATVWNFILRVVLARPGVSAAVAGVAMVALSAPALRMHTEALSVDKILPSSTPIVQTYQRIVTAFPGGPAPALVVAKAPDVQSAGVQDAIASFTRAATADGQFGEPIEVRSHPEANLVEISVPLAGDGADAASRHALRTLQDTIAPATLGSIPDSTVAVSGTLASSLDFNAALGRGIVPVFIFVLAVTFVLMLLVFRSVVIPTVTIGLNLLSVGAAYGALVAVFQYGWGDSLVGTKAPGAVESWVPLFVFVVLFGLSMDYHVFVVSRIKEAHDAGQPTREAVATGIRNTAGVVTSAAVIMVAVFAVFATLSLQQFKQLAVGLGIAVLLDATVVRAVLLPSLLSLLGERSWYLPSWLSPARRRTALETYPAALPSARAPAETSPAASRHRH